MMTKWYLIIIVVCLLCTVYLFYKTSGTLNPGKINIISGVFYLFLVQTFLGISLIVLGFDKHYTLDRLVNREASVQAAFVVIMTVSVVFPLCMFMIQKILKLDARKEYSRYLHKENKIRNADLAFIMLVLLTVFCLFLMLLWFIKIGYIPLYRLICAPKGFEFAMERQRVGNIYLLHPYISNILILTAVPLLAYIAFAYFLTIRGRKWSVLFIVLFIASLLTKTYNFAKSPIVYHLAVFFVIYIYYKGGIKLRHLFMLGSVMAGLLIAMYMMTGYDETLLDIYNGPLGRTLFSQLGALLCVFDAFPAFFGFLGGRSLSGPLLSLIGLNSDMHLRSGKLMMDFYGSESVYDGTAGVLNSFFVGEAYANYGLVGIAFAVVWVSLFITIMFKIILKLNKTPLMMAFFATMTLKIANTSQGGFFDFIFNVDWLFTIIMYGGLYFMLDSRYDLFLKFVQKMGFNVSKNVGISRED